MFSNENIHTTVCTPLCTPRILKTLATSPSYICVSPAPSAMPSFAPSSLPLCAPTVGFGWQGKRLLGPDDRRLQHMTDRFKEEGSVRSFVDSLGYEVDLNAGMGEKENVLSKEDCEGLMALIDHDESGAQDVQKFIDESDLVSVIGKVSVGGNGIYLPLCPCFQNIRSYNCSCTLPLFPLTPTTRTNSAPCYLRVASLASRPQSSCIDSR